VRWHFYSSAIVKEAQKFDERDFGKGARALISLIYNSYVFLETYGKDAPAFSGTPGHILDRWIRGRLHGTAARVAAHLDRYEIAEATGLIEAFADDLSRWYLRRSRKRAEALPVLRHILSETSRLIAPFMPFFAEALYLSLGGPMASVHMESWPLSDDLVDNVLEAGMAEARRIASIALAARAEKGVKVRQPLQSLTLKADPWVASPVREDFISILKDEVNVKEVLFDEGITDEVLLDTTITPELEREGIYRDLVRMAQGLRQSAGCSPRDAVTFHIEAGEKARAALDARLDVFKKDVHANDVVFVRNDACAAEATEDIAGAPVWMGLIR
jgi:isoleucyl-tRNA synthetase